jgi:predicted dehydrogenase
MLTSEALEAVYIATPVHLHSVQAIAAAEAGKHVLCEKPMAMSVGECDRMIAACEAHRVQLGVAYYRHHYPVVERIRNILEAGEVGRPIVAQVNAFERFDPDESDPRRWLIEKAISGGGPMMDFGCHRIEVLLHLFGQVKKVKALAGNLVFDREVEDTATALLQFERGPQAVLSVTHAASEPKDTLAIFCERGSIHVEALNHGEVKIRTRLGLRVEMHPPHPNLHQPLIADFTQAVLNNHAPQVDGRLGRRVARINEEIYQSALNDLSGAGGATALGL